MICCPFNNPKSCWDVVNYKVEQLHRSVLYINFHIFLLHFSVHIFHVHHNTALSFSAVAKTCNGLLELLYFFLPIFWPSYYWNFNWYIFNWYILFKGKKNLNPHSYLIRMETQNNNSKFTICRKETGRHEKWMWMYKES